MFWKLVEKEFSDVWTNSPNDGSVVDKDRVVEVYNLAAKFQTLLSGAGTARYYISDNSRLYLPDWDGDMIVYWASDDQKFSFELLQQVAATLCFWEKITPIGIYTSVKDGDKYSAAFSYQIIFILQTA